MYRLNNIILFMAILIASIFYSCGGNEKPKVKEKQLIVNNTISDSSYVFSEIHKILNSEVSFIKSGNFMPDSQQYIVAGVDTTEGENYGIKFFIFNINGRKLSLIYSTPLLNGSFRDSFTNKLKLPSFNYELIYYNSQDFFIGSGGGEVYAYVIDFYNRQNYYAHLVATEENAISLFLSENNNHPEIKNFLIGTFKRDYPSLKTVKKDININ